MFKVVCLKKWSTEKKFMTGPGQPQTCTHLINAQMFTGVCQAVRMFSPCQCQVYVSIGTLESDFISQCTPCA